jgi:hypothetical protein
VTLDNLIKAISTRIAQLLASRWTGSVTIRIELHRGGISKARIGVDESLI